MNLVDFHHHSVYDLGHLETNLQANTPSWSAVELKTKAKALHSATTDVVLEATGNTDAELVFFPMPTAVQNE